MGTFDFAVEDGQHAKTVCEKNPTQHEVVCSGKQPRLLSLARLRVPDKTCPALVALCPDERAKRKQIGVDKEEDKLCQQDGLRAETAQANLECVRKVLREPPRDVARAARFGVARKRNAKQERAVVLARHLKMAYASSSGV
eukprot:3749338-Prymnesium_polylepis.1